MLLVPSHLNAISKIFSTMSFPQAVSWRHSGKAIQHHGIVEFSIDTQQSLFRLKNRLRPEIARLANGINGNPPDEYASRPVINI